MLGDVVGVLVVEEVVVESDGLESSESLESVSISFVVWTVVVTLSVVLRSESSESLERSLELELELESLESLDLKGWEQNV